MTKNKIAFAAFLIAFAPVVAFAQTTTTTIITDDPAAVPSHTSSSTMTSTETHTIEQQKLKKHMTPDAVNAHEAERNLGTDTNPKPATVEGKVISSETTTTTSKSHSAY